MTLSLPVQCRSGLTAASAVVCLLWWDMPSFRQCLMRCLLIQPPCTFQLILFDVLQIMYIVSQFIFGYGVGGEYPMAAGSAAERAEAGGKAMAKKRGREVVLTFSMQVRSQTFLPKQVP